MYRGGSTRLVIFAPYPLKEPLMSVLDELVAAAKAKPGINEAVLRAQMEANFKLIPPPDGAQMAFGVAPASYWDQTLSILTKYQGMKIEAKAADHYDYSFATAK
mgnify:CR=1 FL=1